MVARDKEDTALGPKLAQVGDLGRQHLRDRIRQIAGDGDDVRLQGVGPLDHPLQPTPTPHGPQVHIAELDNGQALQPGGEAG